MKSRFLAVPFLAATLSGLGAGATQAAPAVDAQVYTGAECVRYSGSSLGKVGSSAYYYNDSATNAVNVICPMVRHHTGNGVDYGSVTYSDRNHATGQRVSCRLLRHARSPKSRSPQSTDHSRPGCKRSIPEDCVRMRYLDRV